MDRFALELAMKHANTRKVGGQALAANQAVQHMLFANAAIEAHAGWQMILDAAKHVDRGGDASASAP